MYKIIGRSVEKPTALPAGFLVVEDDFLLDLNTQYEDGGIYIASSMDDRYDLYVGITGFLTLSEVKTVRDALNDWLNDD
jgi:hypothetical protein